MEPFEPRDALALLLDLERVADDQRLDGEPSTGFVDLQGYRDATVGIWEMTEGAMRDIEADEVFVVLAGAATVELLADSGGGSEAGGTEAGGTEVVRRIELAPGSLCRLEAGMSTRWTVTQTLRKLYVTGDPA